MRIGVNHTDLLLHAAGCKGVYGSIADSHAGPPLRGALILFINLTATSASDGTYRFDLGCAPQGAFGSIAMSVTMAGYQDRSLPMGRGQNLHDYIRQDLDLNPR